MITAETNLQKVALLAAALTKTAGMWSSIAGMFKRAPKPLSLAELLTNPKYTAYLTTKYKNPKMQSAAFAKLQQSLLKDTAGNMDPAALMHLTEQKQLLEQLQGLPSEKLWDMAGRFGEYAAKKPAQALAGTLAGGYALNKGAHTVKDLMGDDSSSGKSRNVFVTS